jgi:GTP-binding protein
MSTNILTAEYVTSIQGTNKILEDRKPQVAFLGRSNVGKSSLINSLVSRQLARSSSKPGKTVNIDFFLINNTYYFVDLPGYGYARVSRDEHDHFRKMIAWYLFRSGVQHKLVVLIVDAVVGVTDYDKESIQLFHDSSKPYVVAANKIDKLKKGERQQHIDAIKKEVGDAPVIPYSSETSEGRAELLKHIFQP